MPGWVSVCTGSLLVKVWHVLLWFFFGFTMDFYDFRHQHVSSAPGNMLSIRTSTSSVMYGVVLNALIYLTKITAMFLW